jgi:glycosyltransferase involved in cell wall biosynthesis
MQSETNGGCNRLRHEKPSENGYRQNITFETSDVHKMPKLSIISHFYNHPEKVERQIQHWNKINPALLSSVEFILVDDCSEDTPKISAGNINLRHFRITTDIAWNQAGARNLGAFHAAGEWGLFFDIDQQLNLDTLETLLLNLDRLDKTTMYYLRIKELVDIINNVNLSNHPNTFLVNMQQFRTRGMYDEDFAGHYGYEDLYMPRVWENSGGSRVLLNDFIFFEDLGFGTTNINRNADRNNALAMEKLRAGGKNSPGILRFEWKEITIPKDATTHATTHL